MTDILVVGNGLGGSLAALSAAHKEESARVELLVTNSTRFDYHSGVIEVLGYVPAVEGATDGSPEVSESPGPNSPEAVRTPLDAIPSLPESHPYRRLGVETVRGALSCFDEAVPGYRGGHADENALVPTHSGRVKPVARYPASMAAGLLSDDRPMRLVGFEQVPDMDPELARDRLEGTVPFEVAAATVAFPGDVRTYPAGPALAAALDADERPDEENDDSAGLDFTEAIDADLPDDETPTFESMDAGMSAESEPTDETPLRRELAERIRGQLDVEPRVGLPAVLGEKAHATVVETLCDRLQAEVFEVPVGPPSIPGRRLESSLRAALTDAGVTVTSGSVGEVETATGRVERVAVDGAWVDPDEVVLATGGVGEGGLVADREGVREPVFDCHVDHPTDRTDWTFTDPLADQPFTRLGVAVDDRLRPLDGEGGVQFENLRAVGRLLGAVDVDAEQSGDGVAIATGFAAGRWSVE